MRATQTERPLLDETNNQKGLRAHTGRPDNKCQGHFGKTLLGFYYLAIDASHAPTGSCFYGTEEFLRVQLRATQAPSVNCPVSIEWGKKPAAVSLHVTR